MNLYICDESKDLNEGDFDEAIDQTAGCLQVFIDFKANEQDMDERDLKKINFLELGE